MTVIRWRRHSELSQELMRSAFWLGVIVGVLLTVCAWLVFA